MQRLNCEHFPCHFDEQDCSLCFCPFYPCGDVRTGGRYKENCWICESCQFIHRSDVAQRVLDDLMRDVPLQTVWRRVTCLL